MKNTGRHNAQAARKIGQPGHAQDGTRRVPRQEAETRLRRQWIDGRGSRGRAGHDPAIANPERIHHAGAE